MAPLRILIITNRIPYPLHDGGAMAMDALIRGYDAAGMQVHLLSMNTTRHLVDAQQLKELYPAIHGFDSVLVNNDVKPLNVLKNLLFSKDPEHVQRFAHPAFAEKLQYLSTTFRPDVVQMESPFLSAYLPFVKHAMRVMRVHNVEYQIWERLSRTKSIIKGAYLKILAKRMRNYEAKIWNEYDLLLPITEVDAAIIREIHPKQHLLVAPYGIEPATPEAPVHRDFLKTYHIGAMDWLPNSAAMDWMLREIWPAMHAQVRASEFHFGGRNMPVRFHQQLPENAVCHGEVSDLDAFYKGKNVLVVPLQAGGGIRIKILEAMAAGKLVISTPIGMQGIQAAPGVHYLEANTAGEFAKSFLWANEHLQEANQICQNGFQLIKDRYSNEAITKNILHRFEALVRK